MHHTLGLLPPSISKETKWHLIITGKDLPVVFRNCSVSTSLWVEAALLLPSKDSLLPALKSTVCCGLAYQSPTHTHTHTLCKHRFIELTVKEEEEANICWAPAVSRVPCKTLFRALCSRYHPPPLYADNVRAETVLKFLSAWMHGLSSLHSPMQPWISSTFRVAISVFYFRLDLFLNFTPYWIHSFLPISSAPPHPTILENVQCLLFKHGAPLHALVLTN